MGWEECSECFQQSEGAIRRELGLQNSNPEKHHLQLHEPGVECNLQARGGQCTARGAKLPGKLETYRVQNMGEDDGSNRENHFWESQ